MQYSSDLSTWTTAVNGSGGVTITTTAYNSSLNYTTVTIPTTAGVQFARLVATVPSTYSGTYSNTVAGGTSQTGGTSKTKAVSSIRGDIGK